MTKYSTTEENLPDDTEGEVVIQVTDTETKEIFETRARVTQSADALDDPEPLTVVRGPHENRREEWFIEILESNVGLEPIDEELLRNCIQDSQSESNLVNTRSEDVRAMLDYLVEVGEFESVSDAVRTIVKEHMQQSYPELFDAYLDAKTEFIRDELSDSLGDSR